MPPRRPACPGAPRSRNRPTPRRWSTSRERRSSSPGARSRWRRPARPSEIRGEKVTMTRDALTGLADRRAYGKRLAGELARLTRYGGELALVLFDLDDFEGVNDARGAAVADEVLRRVAAVLAASCRRGDAAFRLGGDEFALLLPQANAEGAERVAARVAARVRATALGVTMSHGIATVDDHDPTRLHEAAAAALRAARRRLTSV